jgi:hypothetical protein
MKYLTNIEIDNLTKAGLNWIKKVLINADTQEYKKTVEVVESIWGEVIDLNSDWLSKNVHSLYVEPVYHEVHRVSANSFSLEFTLQSDYAPIGLLNKILEGLKVSNMDVNGNVIPAIMFGRSNEENLIPKYPMINFLMDTNDTWLVRKHSITNFVKDMGLSIFEIKDGDTTNYYWKDGEPSDDERIKLDEFLVWAQEKDVVQYLSKNEII